MSLNNKKAEYLCYYGSKNNEDKHNYLKLKIGVCGASETNNCGIKSYDIAKELGKEIIKQGGVLVTGTTTGFPMWSAIGAKEENGIVVGISPAANEREHIDVYRLPMDYMDLIIYTGFGFSGRDLLFARSCDAVIMGCGNIGAISEFSIAFEDGKVVGVLEGEWSTSGIIKKLIERSNEPNKKIVFDKDIKSLVRKVIEMTIEDKK